MERHDGVLRIPAPVLAGAPTVQQRERCPRGSHTVSAYVRKDLAHRRRPVPFDVGPFERMNAGIVA